METFRNFFPLFLLVLSLTGCAQNKTTEILTMEEFKERIRNNDSTMVILDVRTDAEVTGKLPKIEGALHIPLQELGNRVGELEQFRNKEIAVVCRTQNRSSVAAEFLREKGYDAKSVAGGMQVFYKK
jgi:rhodanese-related sulfurtransferase